MTSRTATTTLCSLVASTTLALSLAGCAGAEVEDEITDPELEGLSAEAVEIVENLQLAGFPRDEIEIDEDELVIVGGDAVVNLEASREMLDLDDDDHDHDDSFRQYRTTNLVDPSIEVICIDMTGLTPHPFMVIAAMQTAAMYNAQNLSFDLLPVLGTDPSCDAVIETQLQGGTGASAGFPSGGQPYDLVKMGIGITAYGQDVVRHVFMHEIGHCIGFRHSDYFNRSLSCGSGGNEGSAGVGAHYIPGTFPGFDPFSVMNSCYSSNSTGVFSPFDMIALDMLY